MNIIQKAGYRTMEYSLLIGQKFLNYGVPELLEGEDAIMQLPKEMRKAGISKAMAVAGKTVSTNGIMDGFFKASEECGLEVVLFDGALPNPTIENVEDAVKKYNEMGCKAFVAFGGGSSMDCAKIAAARVSNPNKTVEAMGGSLKVRKKAQPIYAVPTTAGTGSEATIAAVVVNTQTEHKYSVNDPKLLPVMAVLDPKLTVSMPKSVTAATGMDALTHAVEAYTNNFGSKFANEKAKEAVKLIFDNAQKAYDDGENLEARANMLKASWYAGIAFTRNCVGYVHALGHPLGAKYNVAHGKAMAAILPIVLREYGSTITEKLADLGELVGFRGNSRAEVAGKFVQAIEDMNEYMGIPKSFPEIEEKDIEQMAAYAFAEANKTYPVPELWTREHIEKMYLKIKGN